MNKEGTQSKKKENIKNPISRGITHAAAQLSMLEFSPLKFLPSALSAAVLLIVIIILVILWPYGLVMIMEDMLRGLMRDAANDMRNIEGLVAVEGLPYVITIGIYLIAWLPFAALCLPAVIIGGIGRVLLS